MYKHPFNLGPLFLQFLEIWFEKSGWSEKKEVLYYKSTFFVVWEKWLTRKENPSLQIHFSKTTFLPKKLNKESFFKDDFWN